MRRSFYRYRGPISSMGPARRIIRSRGLLGKLMIGGIGYLIGRQQAQSESYSQPQPQSNPQSDQLAQLKLLGELRESGILTEEEFQAQKQKILQAS